MPMVLKTPPASEPLSLDEVKKFLRLELSETEEDVLLTTLIAGAREYAESYQNRPLVTQTWQLYLDRFPYDPEIELKPGLQSVVSVKYTTADGAEIVFSADNYEVDNKSIIGKLILKNGISWPTDKLKSVNGVCVEFVCGYGDAEDVPKLTKTAMKIWIAYQYADRQGEEQPKAVDILLNSERVITA